ncbi:hypothetical protein ACFO9Q_12825 [Paenibacillus sp. GCM10023252]|uniref:putative amidoligase domain-containing protein n=1 Tax=Paenibacillus sp. GCM10023252 TaxID=3252649 RepID=UPI00360A054E
MAIVWIWRGIGLRDRHAQHIQRPAGCEELDGEASLALVGAEDAVLVLGSGWPGCGLLPPSVWVLNNEADSYRMRRDGGGAALRRRAGTAMQAESAGWGGMKSGVGGVEDPEVRMRLREAGLTVVDSSIGRLYLVQLFHLEVIMLQRINDRGQPLGRSLLQVQNGAEAEYRREGFGKSSTQGTRPEWDKDPLLRRVVRTALRAAYALQLDLAEVEVVLGDEGQTAVRGAWPLSDAPELRPALGRFAAWYTAARGGAGAGSGQLLIGADPEFVLVRADGRIASAARYLHGGAWDGAGTDALVVGGRVLRPVAELRPEPAANPAALAANVRRLLAIAAARISEPGLRWAAGAMPVPGLPLGGHIHLSGVPLSSRLLRLLDSYAAFPLAMVEDPAGRGRRPRYGALGDFRLQGHGGFEYRTLPSWLVSPAAAKAAFALAMLCAREAWNLSYIPALEERYVTAYYTGDRDALAETLPAIAASLAATASYPDYAAYIEPLLEAAARGVTWNERTDFRPKWRIGGSSII